MTIRRHISLIILALCALAAPAHAQLIFTPDSWDFGTISETDGRVSHTFTGENRSDKPVVILDVVTTCGCTVPEFTKRPIRPGEKTTIKVTFDPTNRPGAFTKELGVYSSERKKVATLTIRGNVTPRMKSTEELYPVDAGGGLRLSTTLNAFSYIRPGQQVQSAIGYANTSGKTIRLELRPLESSGLLTVTAPREIAPGEQGSINVAYLIPEADPRYGTLRDALEVRVDGRTNGMFMAMWGVLGLFWVKLCLPWMLRLVNRIPWNWRYTLTTVCAALMIVDCGMTLMSLDRWYQREAGVAPDNAISRFIDDHFDNQYMEERFQSMSIDPDNAARTL